MLDSFPFLAVQIFRIAKHYASSAVEFAFILLKKGVALSYRRLINSSLAGIYLKAAFKEREAFKG
ncbi:hypothetical protein DB41_KR00070 [Neochlamydia sp. TUME1]|nr:hypothetical protein DB41_KR00070 [Neochlamydia sp. TUME1]